MELLNEAVMPVWGWRASCPAASWASFCCGGLTEPKEEAHFRVIYYHPNTSCLLRGLRKALATPFLGGTSFPCKPLKPLIVIFILLLHICDPPALNLFYVLLTLLIFDILGPLRQRSTHQELAFPMQSPPGAYTLTTSFVVVPDIHIPEVTVTPDSAGSYSKSHTPEPPDTPRPHRS